MKIAFNEITATVAFGGVQTVVWELAKTLVDLGHQVTVYGGDGDVRPDFGGRDVRVRTFPFTRRERAPWFGSRFAKLVERASFARHARREVAVAGHDWIILTKPLDFFWPLLLPRGTRTRFCFMSGGTDFIAFDRRLAPRIDAFVAASHFTAWQAASRFKRFPAVIWNGVEVERFRPGIAPAAVREALGIGAGDIVLVSAGRLVGLKGLAYAVRALAEPVLAGRAVKLVLVGDGPERVRLEALARELGVAEKLVFAGAKPHAEMPGWYALADIGVFPSIADEAFGIVIAECMSCARPVVASWIGGIPEVVGNEGSCGLLVPPADPQAIATAVARLADDSALRTRMGERARERIVGTFTWEASARRLLAALERAGRGR